MFFRAPGLLPAGKRIQGPASLVDVAPTVLDLLGLAPLEGADGRSLARRAAGKETGADGVVFGETLMGRLEYGWSDLFMARDARFKYVQAPVPELYDIEKDPGETKNLVRAESGKAGEMAAALGGWLARLSKKDSAAGEASRSLSPDEEERLRSLGYLAGDAFKAGGHGEGKEAARPDPKSMIEEARRLSEAGAKAARGDAAGALADVERILAGNPGNFKARELRVDVLCRLGRFDDAESEAKAGISLTKADPNSPAVVREKSLGLLATTYRRQKKLREAEATYREILALDPGGNVAPAELARVLADQGRFEEALAQAQESLKRDPGNGVALAARFVAETGLGRQAAALETAVSLATARGCDPDTSIQAGDLLMRSDKPDLAARSYAAARSQSGEDAVLLGKLGTAFLMAGKLDDAANAFRKVAELLPGDPRPDYFLGQVALKGGNTQAARAAFSRSLEKDPTFKQAREALGRL
jgi:tetratricopeptide (TPR) repeat protein